MQNLGRKEVSWSRGLPDPTGQHSPQDGLTLASFLEMLSEKGIPPEKCYIPIPLLKIKDFHQKSRALKSPIIVCLTLPECFPNSLCHIFA